MTKLTRKTRHKINRLGIRTCDICHEKSILVEHHIKGRDIPHYNHPSNLANLCSNCHMKVHTGLFIVEKWVRGTQGKELIWHCQGENSVTGENSYPYIIKS